MLAHRKLWESAIYIDNKVFGKYIWPAVAVGREFDTMIEDKTSNPENVDNYDDDTNEMFALFFALYFASEWEAEFLTLQEIREQKYKYIEV